MDPMKEIGKWLLIAGGLFVVIGILLYFGSRVIPFGRLPGDIRIEGKNFTFFFPIVTSVILSIILTIIINIFLSRK